MRVSGIFENMAPTTYVRARAEQLAIQHDADKFSRLYMARAVNFGSKVGETARETFDEFIAPFREQAIKEFTAATDKAKDLAAEVFAKTIETELGKAGLTGEHDAAEITVDELDAFKHIVGE